MSASRDDFFIAIRSAFLKKSTKQKFSLLTLVFISILIIVLSSLSFRPVLKIRSLINEIVYRSSFVVSIPENLIKNSYLSIKQYSDFYADFQKNKVALENLESQKILSEIITSENRELKDLIEDYTLTKNKILAKVIVDHDSPFLKTIIINKGSTDAIKIGTNIYDKNYLVGRVIEVNFKSSRVLLLTDLNSSLPISIIPKNIQAIVTGDGKNAGEIKYVKDNLIEDISNDSVAYTSGTGSIFKSGVPVGSIMINKDKIIVNFYSDYSQLKYVFAEIEDEGVKLNTKKNQKEKKNTSTEKIKLDILNEEIAILKETNMKFVDENKSLQDQIYQQSIKTNELQIIIDTQNKKISQHDIDQNELKFLKLNLKYSSKCKKSFIKQTGYKVGTKEYKDCILKKGKN
jgi:rod shape-determining protein MreC